MDENGGPTPRRRSAAHAPSTRPPSHFPLSRASTRHTIPHASPPTDRPTHSEALPPTASTSHSITHNPCTNTPTTCLRAETPGLPERFKTTQTRSSGRTGKTTSHTRSSSTTKTTTWRALLFQSKQRMTCCSNCSFRTQHGQSDPLPNRPAPFVPDSASRGAHKRGRSARMSTDHTRTTLGSASPK